jgi:putative membrane-bound dehydrogenase-like protein
MHRPRSIPAWLAVMAACGLSPGPWGRAVAEPPAASPHAVDTQRPGETPPAAADLVAGMKLPDGFRAVVFAAEPDVAQPIAMATDERGRLWVVENYSYPKWRTEGTDRVLIYDDADGDGRHDTRKTFLDGGRNLTGIEIGRGGVWLTSPPELVFVPDRDRDDVPDGPPETILDGFTTVNVEHNIVNGLRWGPDGWLYGRHGIKARSTVGTPGTPAAARTPLDCGIWRVHPESRRFEVVARGTTNPWGFDYDDLGEMAFTNNVIGHLWHLVPGAHYERMYGSDPEPHVYELMPQAADHLHWAGREWTASREVDGRQDPGVAALGGGHSHCGGMVYLGDMFPRAYRGKMFMCNTHGKRVNVDALEHGPRGLVGHHEPDFLDAADTWFRGIELVSGPDGRVWIADWTDRGECHDHDGIHRTSGRIYTVLAGSPRPPVRIDLAALPDAELVALQLHENDWFCRQARRLLADRTAAGRDVAAAGHAARTLAETHADPTRRLRGLWAAHAIGAADPDWLRGRLADPHPSLRAWAVRLLIDAQVAAGPSAAADMTWIGDVLERLATTEPAGLVRLHLAGAIGRLPHDWRWRVAGPLAARAEDADWTALSLLIWYGLRDPVAADPARAVTFTLTTPLPVLWRLVARRLAFDADRSPAMADALAALVEAAADRDALHMEVARGVTAAWKGRRRLVLPDLLRQVVAADADLAPLLVQPAAVAAVATPAGSRSFLERLAAAPAAATTPAERRTLIKAWHAKLTADELSRADLPAGRRLWIERCAGCHRLFGEGGAVGPDLTGSGRTDTEYVILNVIAPSDTVPEAWRLTRVVTADGRVLSGAVVESDERTLTLRAPAGDVVLDRDDVDEVVVQNVSLMPEGLWAGLADEQVRDLVAYLASPAQVPLDPAPPAANRGP